MGDEKMETVENRCLKVKWISSNPVTRGWAIETYPIQGLWGVDIEKEPLYIFTETELRRFDKDVSALMKKNRQLNEELEQYREYLNEQYREYLKLQNKLSDKEGDDDQ